ncbi:MAG: hypothetical protein A2096_01970 [Spirochaetes bacterium GWF1_41_5]|nr:MAG: hypothetical protein A2096_01970 [Spirochaetes bacterium GWF1_41_5]HBE02558.1 hypothetical protein [Spirochaetia bacterium]
MNRITETVILSVIQGLTEFLPVSSSAHLQIFKSLTRLAGCGLLLDTVLHAGTMCATLLVFRRQLYKIAVSLPQLFKNTEKKEYFQQSANKLVFFLLIATLPAAAVGITAGNFIEKNFENLYISAVGLFITSLFLLSTLFKGHGLGLSSLTYRFPLLVGLMQALAICPGISRSGATICTALLLGSERSFAGEFSFLLSLPVIAGAFLLQILKTPVTNLWVEMPFLLTAFTVSFISGWVSLSLLIPVVKKGKMHLFAFYTIPLGAALFIYLAVKGF